MIEVAVAAFGLTGVIMVAAVVAGLIAGALLHLVSLAPRHHDIEARGHQHNSSES